MTPIAYPILRTGRTDIDGSVVVTPSGGSTGTPIVAADLVNGFTPITVSFTAGETSKPVSFAVADDSAVEGTETYRLTMSNPQPSGAFPSGAFVEGTVGDNDTGGGGGAQTLTYVYPPTDGAADSGTQNIQSTQQQCGRTWRSAAPKWKVQIGRTADGAQATGLVIIFDDAAGSLAYQPYIDSALKNPVTTLTYIGASPSSTEPYTYVRINPDLSIDCCCAATAPTTTKPKPDNERILRTLSSGIWDDLSIWGDQSVADRVPDKYAQANAHEALANGIYAARLGAVQ